MGRDIDRELLDRFQGDLAGRNCCAINSDSNPAFRLPLDRPGPEFNVLETTSESHGDGGFTLKAYYGISIGAKMPQSHGDRLKHETIAFLKRRHSLGLFHKRA